MVLTKRKTKYGDPTGTKVIRIRNRDYDAMAEYAEGFEPILDVFSRIINYADETAKREGLDKKNICRGC
jgi:hypothetical protein